MALNSQVVVTDTSFIQLINELKGLSASIVGD